MIVKICRGIGNPGKLWTGDEPETGSLVNAKLLHKICPQCGHDGKRIGTAQVFRVDKESTFSPEAVEALEVQTLFLTMGGVGSTCSNAVNTATEWENLDLDLSKIQCWNWSGRCGGHAILNPLAVMSGYVGRGDLPKPKQGFVWVQTYSGSTLSEYVLLREDMSSHALPTVEVTHHLCPPCRQRQEVEGIPEGLLVTREHFAIAGATSKKFEAALFGSELPSNSETIPARSLCGLAHDEYCSCRELYTAAIDAARTATSSETEVA